MSIRIIDDERAPFATEEAACEVGLEHLRRLAAEDRGSPMGAFAERQPDGNGFYVRVAWSILHPPRRPRARRIRETRAAEIGLRKTDAVTAAHVAIVFELHNQSTGGVDDRPDDYGVATIRGLPEIDVERLASAVVKAIRKGTTLGL